MNMKTGIASAFLASLLFISCKKELQPQESTNAPVTDVAAPDAQPIQGQVEGQTQTMQSVQAPAQMQPTPSTAPGMNPPHGQPNHRCDIAVGAPLNSPKGATPPAAPQVAPQGQAAVAPVAMPSAPVVTQPGMNPPHGQEGHRCEIAVGAPLPK